MVSFTSQAAKYASKFINSTNSHVFLTGKAGTGKTTFLKYITEHSYKNTIVAAPTGIAAINAGGVTLHSLFQLPFGTFLPSNNINYGDEISTQISTPQSILSNRQMNRTKRAMLQELELLIIDEVSMLRADLLDAINVILKSIRRNNRPFGGVQILFIGDLWQLPPVVKDDEWQYLRQFYSSIFFFEALALKNDKPIFIELDKIYRQDDLQFIELLNHLRRSRLTTADYDILNEHYKPDFKSQKGDGYIRLVTHNYQADDLNKDSLRSLPGKSYFFDAEIEGEFKEYQYPLPFTLELKKDAQVMFIKNDYSGESRYFNGKIGIVSDISSDSIEVEFNDGSPPAIVDIYTWENKRYTLNKETNQIEEQLLGTFSQYPVKPAWAITVHKSQGLTFERAIIDVSKAFASGQVYVALSRLTSLDGLVLTGQLPSSGIEPDESLKVFAKSKASNEELTSRLEKDSHSFIREYMLNAFNLSMLSSQIRYHVISYNKDKARSAKQLYLQWAKELQDDAEKLKEVSDKFSKQITSLFDKESVDYENYLLKRITSAKEYFEPLLKSFSERIFSHINDLKSEKKIKKYISELRELERLFFRQLQLIYKAEAILKASIKNKDISKELIGESELYKSREKMLEEEKVTKKKRHKTKTTKAKKEKKVNTRELSFNMYKSGMSIEEIAKERGFVNSTIENHLASYVAKGELKAHEFITEEKLLKILDAIKETGSLKLGELISHLGNSFTYSNISIGVAHYISQQED